MSARSSEPAIKSWDFTSVCELFGSTLDTSQSWLFCDNLRRFRGGLGLTFQPAYDEFLDFFAFFPKTTIFRI